MAVALVATGGVALSQRLGHHRPRPVAHTAAPPVQSNPNPVVAGWRAVLAPGHGVAYDVPQGWKPEDPGTALGFDDSKGRGVITTIERGVAELNVGKCTRAQSGLRGGSNPLPKPSPDQLLVLGGDANEQAHNGANAAYGAYGPGRPHPPKLRTVRDDKTTTHGISVARVALAVTTTGRTRRCTPPRAVVETITMAATADASTLGPLNFTVFADRGVSGQLGDADIDRIIGSIRPYHCPPGKRTHQDNRCS